MNNNKFLKELKNIILIGPSRSGKTTLANMIKNEFGYNIVTLDDLVNAFGITFPELNISQEKDEKEVSKQFTKFLINLLLFYNNEFNKRKNIRRIIEGIYIDLDILFKEIKKEDFIIIGLHYSNRTEEQFLKYLKKYDTKLDWTIQYDDNGKLKSIKHFLNRNKDFMKMYKKYEILNYDVSENRELVFETILKDLRKLLLNQKN